MSQDLIALYEKLIAAGKILADESVAQKLGESKPVGKAAIVADPKRIHDNLTALFMSAKVVELVRRGMSYWDAMNIVQSE